ncbi:DUF3188 domain-containing protein [Virgibacillus dakarensis]|uniref:DUF3188 domain-containing protein n=1 Tax=Lentibacillus populi TaxID=1827502 RepID=A0A9W5TXI8_9BACI|nr:MULTISPECIES: DUF3188 domain-containing protein [Bacillaceae]MBT2217208.1 hypothetical protein [Virgibacillus dakarensis]MTW85790.1 DUF3188 domain-containing protein [Virgibacillus dakarensis]GGB43255.1 hypothetical protein GCM10011409_21060 [Lentibacillus populi]
MAKGGLFLLSIGCLLLLFSANAKTGKYDILNMTTALFLIIVGTIIVFKEKKEKKKKNKKEKD